MRDRDRVFQIWELAGPTGQVLVRYRDTHRSVAEQRWASAGEGPQVVATPLGRIGLATAGDLAVPEVAGLDQALRADLLAVTAGDPAS